MTFLSFQGLDNLTTYTFNTHVAQHTFCKTCGVQSFYTPRSNPDGYGTTFTLPTSAVHLTNHTSAFTLNTQFLSVLFALKSVLN